MMAKLARFAALPTAEQGRTVEAAFYLFAVRAVFGLLPLRRALQVFGIAASDAGRGGVSAPQAELIGRAIERAARHVPFRAVCLQQAFAALLMLRRRGLPATVQLGLIREGNELKAHAWSLSGDVPVTGVARAVGYAAVAAFAA
jgi:Transglutaminase-like superfamily